MELKWKRFIPRVKEKGILHTLRYSVSHVNDMAKIYVDGSFDRKYNTDTTGYVALPGLRIESKYVNDSNWYQPMPEPIIKQLINTVPIHHDEYTFVDYGSGKGRVLLVAANYPFRRVVGIEFARELHETALRNLKTYRNPEQRCMQIESICIDAVEYELPNEPCVLMFFNPFKPPLLAKVIERIKQSILAHPRSIWLIWYGAIPDSIKLIQNCGFQCREIMVRHLYRERFKGERAFLLSGPLTSHDSLSPGYCVERAEMS